MSLRKILITIALAWLLAITLLHGALNLHLFRSKDVGGSTDKKFRIGVSAGDRIFRVMGMSLRVGETATA